MKGLKGKVLAFFLICAVISSFCALPLHAVENPKKGPEILLTFMNTMNDEENETLYELVKEFNKKRPDVKIQIENVSFYDARTIIENRFKGGSLPDIMRVEIRLVVPFAKAGMFRPLDSYIATEDYVDYLPYLYKFSVTEGKNLFGIPQVTDCLALFYNKKHFDDAKLETPKTMDQFLKCARALTIDEEGNNNESTDFNQFKIARYGFSYHFESYYLLPFVFSYGGNLCDENKKPLLKTEKTKAALKFIYELKNKFNAVPAKIDPKFGHDFTLMEFMDGRVSMIIDGPWNIKKILKGTAFSKSKDNLGIALIPRKEVSGSPIGGQYLTVSSKCAHPKEAYEFINFINSKDAQSRFARQNYIIPTRKSVMNEMQNDGTTAERNLRKALFEQMKSAALYTFNIPEPRQLEELNKMIEKLLNGLIGFDEALEKLSAKFEEYAK